MMTSVMTLMRSLASGRVSRGHGHGGGGLSVRLAVPAALAVGQMPNCTTHY
jgi:hypothetical protein